MREAGDKGEKKGGGERSGAEFQFLVILPWALHWREGGACAWCVAR